ncbi:MAG TPA: hypothetical protein VGM64_01710 [Lacunisphaera sp.]|jgi:hypothetical protein
MNKNEAGYEQVRAALKGRNYTVFSGHLHHYAEGEHDGMKHYVLATVGGDSKVALPPGETLFHLNIGWVDHDRLDNTKPSVLWWHDESIAEFGAFTLAP